MQVDKENKKQTHSLRSSKHQEDSGPADKTRSSDHAARAISRFHNTNSRQHDADMQADKEQTHSVWISKHQEDSGPAEKRR